MKKLATAVVAATALLASGGAFAQAYVGGALGFSTLDADVCDDIPGCDDTDTGFKLYGGFKFHPNFAVEGVYIDWGSAKVSGPGGSASVDASSLGVGIAGTLDFAPNFSGVARFGFASNQLDATVRGPGFSYSADESKVKPYFGLGLAYKIAPNLRLEGGVDFTTLEADGEDVDARLISVGVRYEF